MYIQLLNIGLFSVEYPIFEDSFRIQKKKWMERMFVCKLMQCFLWLPLGLLRTLLTLKLCRLHVIRIIVFVLGSYLHYVIILLGYHIATLYFISLMFWVTQGWYISSFFWKIRQTRIYVSLWQNGSLCHCFLKKFNVVFYLLMTHNNLLHHLLLIFYFMSLRHSYIYSQRQVSGSFTSVLTTRAVGLQPKRRIF